MQQNNQKKSLFTNWKFYGSGLMMILVVALSIGCFRTKPKEMIESDETGVRELECDLDYSYDYGKANHNRVIDRWSGQVILDDLSWISDNEGDSLVAYAQKNRRGYLNLRTREARLLPEKFVKIYLYREGRALVESLDSLYIIDPSQRVVAQFAKTGERDTEVNYFHKGYFPMIGDNGKLGLIDTCGQWVKEPQYDKVSFALDEFWIGITNPVMVDEKTGRMTDPHRIVMDSRLRTVMEGDWVYLMVTNEGYVTVADKNHWQWRYNLDGTVIDDFVCRDVVQLKYSTGEYKVFNYADDVCRAPEMHEVIETATLVKYITSEGWEGLMTREGKIITPPVFWQIKAVSKNLYLCAYDTSDDHAILLNEKGERCARMK